jgi:hypothetical protein
MNKEGVLLSPLSPLSLPPLSLLSLSHSSSLSLFILRSLGDGRLMSDSIQLFVLSLHSYPSSLSVSLYVAYTSCLVMHLMIPQNEDVVHATTNKSSLAKKGGPMARPRCFSPAERRGEEGEEKKFRRGARSFFSWRNPAGNFFQILSFSPRPGVETIRPCAIDLFVSNQQDKVTCHDESRSIHESR